jgi:hypothetical protein
MTRFLIRFYGIILHLYPREFRAVYGDEMRSVFAEILPGESGIKSAILFLYERFDLPVSI